MMCAEQECRNVVRLLWSEYIHDKMTQVHILRLYMSSLRDKIDCTNEIDRKQQSLKVQQPLPPRVKEKKNSQSGSTTSTETVERIPIQTNILSVGLRKSIYCESPEYVPVRAARIFKNFKDSSGIYSELPIKRHKGGGLNTIGVPLPLERETMYYHTTTTSVTSGKRKIHH